MHLQISPPLSLRRRPPEAHRQTIRGLHRDLVIGLVNIMPPAAMLQTDRQFTSLLNLAARQRTVHVKYFSTFHPSRNTTALSSIDHAYADINALWNTHLDGLIVTGTEPHATSMTDEPDWPMLAALVDWAADNTISTLWSCFSAHAAVFRLNGIGRQRFAEKLSGVFECTKVTAHEVVAAAPPRWYVPHSRHNSLPEEELRAHGYIILSHAPCCGADIFMKQCHNSQFVFFHGHPEYDAETLFGEYCRDIRRFLTGQRLTYPSIPKNYFDQETEKAFSVFQKTACSLSDPVPRFNHHRPTIDALPHPWHEQAVQLYTGWLSYISAQKIRAINVVRHET